MDDKQSVKQLVLTTSIIFMGVNAIFFTQAFAKDTKQPIAKVQISPGSVNMQPHSHIRNGSLSVSGPDGLYLNNASTNNGAIRVDNPASLPDGVYSYEYSASSDEVRKPAYKDSLDNGRDNSRLKRSGKQYYESVYQSGSFRILNGQLVNDKAVEQGFDGDQ